MKYSFQFVLCMGGLSIQMIFSKQENERVLFVLMHKNIYFQYKFSTKPNTQPFSLGTFKSQVVICTVWLIFFPAMLQKACVCILAHLLDICSCIHNYSRNAASQIAVLLFGIHSRLQTLNL